MTIVVEHTISMGHRLPSYEGICSSPHGHNMRVEVEIETFNKFIDFKSVKDHLISVLAYMDHAMLLWEHDPLLKVLLGMQFRVYIMYSEPTTEAIAAHIYALLTAGYKDLRRVTVFETDKYSATCRG